MLCTLNSRSNSGPPPPRQTGKRRSQAEVTSCMMGETRARCNSAELRLHTFGGGGGQIKTSFTCETPRKEISLLAAAAHTDGALVLRRQEETINMQNQTKSMGTLARITAAPEKQTVLNKELLSGCCKTSSPCVVTSQTSRFVPLNCFKDKNLSGRIDAEDLSFRFFFN